MTLRHIDEGIPEVMGEVEDFEIENGRVEDLIQLDRLGCQRCGEDASKFERITYVITESGNILWWHTDRCVLR